MRKLSERCFKIEEEPEVFLDYYKDPQDTNSDGIILMQYASMTEIKYKYTYFGANNHYEQFFFTTNEKIR